MSLGELDRLIWIDMEMTGLNPSNDFILELAAVVTNNQLEIIAQSPSIAIYQSEFILQGMDEWNQRTHSKSGLLDRVRASDCSEQQAQLQMLSFLESHLKSGASPMCGNSIGQDRRFMARWMPELENFFHYRNIDVSTLKELARRWRPDILKEQPPKESRHEALADIYDSIAELRFYQQYFLRAEA